MSLNCKIPSHGNIDGIVESGTGDHCFDREPRTKKKEERLLLLYAYLVGVLESMTIDTVVGSVQATFGEPNDVTGLETTCTDCLEWSVPVKSFFGNLRWSVRGT